MIYGNVVGGSSGGGGGPVVSTSFIVVYAPTGSDISVSGNGQHYTTEEDNGMWTFGVEAIGSYTAVMTTSDGVYTRPVNVEEAGMTYSTDFFTDAPVFTYTGDYALVNDDDTPYTEGSNQWKLRFLTSGVLTFQQLRGAYNGIDVFCVGGGGNGGNGMSGINGGGAGGGGGYTITGQYSDLKIGVPYDIIIGGATGASTAFGFIANGGQSGENGRDSAIANGGNGGSGGGDGASGVSISNQRGGTGGSNGSNGLTFNGAASTHGGNGQGTTTAEFGEDVASVTKYSGAGGGGGGHYSSSITGVGGSGGVTGGGSGGNGSSSSSGKGGNGVDNTGGGGGGSNGAYANAGGIGGSGIVIIRNKRGVQAA